MRFIKKALDKMAETMYNSGYSVVLRCTRIFIKQIIDVEEISLKKVSMLLTVLALMTSFTACGTAAESSMDITIATVNVEETETETEPAEKSSAAEEAEGGPLRSEVGILLDALNTIDKLSGCAIDQDQMTTCTDESGTTYYKVTSTQFTSTEDIRSYMNGYLTQDFIHERYSTLLDGDTPLYIDNDGALFVRGMARGCGFAFTDKEPVVEHSSEDGYTILAEYDNYGAMDTLAVLVTQNEGGDWVIYGLSFGM